MTNDARLRAKGVALLAMALLLPPMARGQTELPPEQVEAIMAARLPGVLDQAAANQPVPWNDDPSGLSGSITVFTPTFPPGRGGRPCRALRYTIEGASARLAIEGERCRLPDGTWGPGRLVDRVLAAPEASPLIRDLQSALRRLAYYDGPVDGVASTALGRAVLAFEHDEQVPPDAEPSPGLLELAEAAIGRIPAPGSCFPEQAVPDGLSAACGTVR